MMRSAILFGSLFISFHSAATSLVEDLIDIGSGVASLGLELKQREMDEEELKAQLDKKFEQKRLALVAEANKQRFNDLSAHIVFLQKSIYEKEQILNSLSQSLDLVEALRVGYKSYLANKAQSAVDAESLIESLDLQRENLVTLYDLILLISSDLKSRNQNEVLSLPLISSNLDQILREMKLTRDQLVLISVHLSDQERLKKTMSSLVFLSMQLGSLQSRMQAQIKSLKISLDSKLQDLEGLR